MEGTGPPRFYEQDNTPYCEWRGTTFRVVDVRGERFLIPVSVWEREEFRAELLDSLAQAVKLFQEAMDRGAPFEDARYLLPEGSLSLLEFEGTI